MTLIDLPALRERVRRAAANDARTWAMSRGIGYLKLLQFLKGDGCPCKLTLRAVDAEQVTLYRVPDEQWPADAVENCR